MVGGTSSEGVSCEGSSELGSSCSRGTSPETRSPCSTCVDHEDTEATEVGLGIQIGVARDAHACFAITSDRGDLVLSS